MKLNTEQIRTITHGAEYVTETDEGRVKFHRFTAEQEQVYKECGNADFFQKTFSTAGVQLVFRTDSETLFLKVKTEKSSSRTFFSHDVLVNGKRIGSLDNFSDRPLPQNYINASFPMGVFSKQFDIGAGEKEVRILFPFSVVSEVEELSLSEGATVEPLKPEKRIVFFGDSITHGYDAVHVENRYAAKVASALHAEEFNKGIGGEFFYPPLAEAKEPFEPDYIVVAYGTNDWSQRSRERFEENCPKFYAALARNYPNSKIFALTPIWRKDHLEHRDFGSFFDVEKIIRSIAEKHENIICISGWDFVPKDEKYFSDLRLHPNDAGFAFYADNLVKAIKESADVFC